MAAVPGVYMLEVIRLFESATFNVSEAHAQCMSSLLPVVLARLYVRPRERAWTGWGAIDQSQPTPVFTRYQQDCWERHVPSFKSANRQVNARQDQLIQSRFAWGTWTTNAAQNKWLWSAKPSHEHGTFARLPLLSPPNVSGLCFVGDSHAAHMCDRFPGCRLIPHEFPKQTLSSPGRFRSEADQEEIVAAARSCKIRLAMYGQWDLSSQPRQHRGEQVPTPPHEFEQIIGRLLVHGLQPGGSRIDYVLTMSHDPIGCKASACPAEDWRIPPMVEAYNDAIRRAVRAAANDVELIELEDITSPVWDHSADWSHSAIEVQHVMVTRIWERLSTRVAIVGNRTA